MTPEQMFEGGTNSYNNWIEFSTGGLLTSGNKASFHQQQQISGGAFGGVAGFPLQNQSQQEYHDDPGRRAIVDQHDYKLKLGIERENTGYVRLSYNEFRTWSDGDGGFFPPSASIIRWRRTALGLDRGAFHPRSRADAGKRDQRHLQIHSHFPRR